MLKIEVTLSKAKSHLGTVLSLAECGITVVITRYGKEKYKLIPYESTPESNTARVKTLLRLLKRKRITQVEKYLLQGFEFAYPKVA